MVTVKKTYEPILEQNVKETSIECIFRREALNPQTLKTTYGFFSTTVTFKVWNRPEFEQWSFTKIIGSGPQDQNHRHARIIKMFLFDGQITFEIPFNKAQTGYDVKRSTEKRISKQKAEELLASGNVRYFENEDLSGNMVYFHKD